jgi:ABC-type Fe3+-hydroxamate transport system substrate-binding protein
VKRVVSLVPSSTETLLALGADVVACTRFCEQPTVRQVGGTKNPDIAEIVGLAPDLVVMDREENRLEDHDALFAAGLDVFVSDVRSIHDAVAVVGDLAVAADVTVPPASELLSRCEGPRHTAFVPIWRRPWMTISSATYGGSLLDHLGIDLVGIAADTDVAYPTADLDLVAGERPDVVLVPSEPYEFTEAHVDELRDAFDGSAVVRVDGQDLFWWGSRTTAAVERLSRVLARPPTA